MVDQIGDTVQDTGDLAKFSDENSEDVEDASKQLDTVAEANNTVVAWIR